MYNNSNKNIRNQKHKQNNLVEYGQETYLAIQEVGSRSPAHKQGYQGTDIHRPPSSNENTTSPAHLPRAGQWQIARSDEPRRVRVIPWPASCCFRLRPLVILLRYRASQRQLNRKWRRRLLTCRICGRWS